MSQIECTCTPQSLCYASDREWPQSIQRGIVRLTRSALRSVGQALLDWHTGGRSMDLIDSLNEQQLRDIGMGEHKSKRDIERAKRENHLWHLPLL